MSVEHFYALLLWNLLTNTEKGVLPEQEPKFLELVLTIRGRNQANCHGRLNNGNAHML